MTGFKSGASDDDPLGSDESDEDMVTERSDVTETPATSVETNKPERRSAELSTPSGSELPWIFDRSSITDGREKTVQLHLQQSTLDSQRQTRSDVESELGETVKKADLREAAIIVGLEQVDDLTEILEEWGYGR
ncbi:hypothetical protein [Haloarcula argentinensis]|uniref:Uncharacterized protein n=1 Tax=Haloarcula argentinensis TaxID=43776 RepID=A0A830FGX0_HALAR|nr:hypothetical protein [Haloarcula argentinensis]EMA18008.1 hypothetical protein C443_19997 [Haloarcula argentinensis DSM 12282]MDS0255737.1 hypothetical protein [Haloarcula argentinensis]GGM48993.1 hypothetical protein GCM10009006_32810 [Haloarcula argentinensis]